MIQADANVLFVPSAKSDVRFAAYPLVESEDIDFYAAAGMRDEQGYLVGAMCVTSCQPKLDWNMEDQGFLETCAVDAMQKVLRIKL